MGLHYLLGGSDGPHILWGIRCSQTTCKQEVRAFASRKAGMKGPHYLSGGSECDRSYHYY